MMDKDQETEDQVEDEKTDHEEHGLEVIEAHLMMILLILNLKNVLRLKEVLFEYKIFSMKVV